MAVGEPRLRGPGALDALKSAVVWTVAIAGGLLLYQYVVAAGPDDWTIWFWTELVTSDLESVLPFVAVVAGLRLVQSEDGRTRDALVAGLALAAGAWLMAALVTPLVEYAGFTHGDRYGADIEMFGVQTPAGVLRNLEHVLENPPATYSMSVEHPDRAYPSRLEMELHYPFVVATLAFLNTFVGLFLGMATSGMKRRHQRLARWSAGLAGVLALVAVIVLFQGPHRDWENVSGIVAAWTPVAVPAAQLLVFARLARREDPWRTAPAASTTECRP